MFLLGLVQTGAKAGLNIAGSAASLSRPGELLVCATGGSD